VIVVRLEPVLKSLQAGFGSSTMTTARPAGSRGEVPGLSSTYCFATPPDHLLRSSYPGDVQSAFVRFDSSTRTTVELALSIDLEGVALQRARLPPSKTGLLLRQRGGARCTSATCGILGRCSTRAAVFC
jgi:hypothetical protein